MGSSIARGPQSPLLIGPKKRKEGKNELSAHLRSLFAAIGASNDF